MEPQREAYESREFKRQMSPILLVTAASSFAFIATVAAAATWYPFLLAAAYPIAIFAVALGASFRRGGALRVDHQGVWWRGSLVAPRGGIVSLAREGGLVTLRTDSSWRSVQRFYAPNEAAAQSMVAAIGEADERPAVSLRLGSPTARYGTGAYFVILFTLAAWALVPLLVRTVGAHSPWLLAQSAAGFLALALMLVPTHVTLGADGMEIRWLWRSRWVRWLDVASVEVDRRSDALLLKMKRGDTVRISAEAAFAVTDANAADELLKRIEKAINDAAEARPHVVAAALARGDSTTAEWVSRLRALVSCGVSGYRAASVSAEDVEAVLNDKAADPSLRAAAAVAYAPAGGADAVKRAAEAVASTHVRVALDAAVSSDEEGIARALDAIEAERGRSEP